MTRKEIKDRLYQLADTEYKSFNDKLIPGVTDTLGVRVPTLRTLAKEISKGDWRSFTTDDAKACYEERMLHGMVIGYAKMDLKERFAQLDRFVPLIDNWAVCDSCCITYQFMKNEQEKSFAYLQKYLRSDAEYEVRFALVSLLDHFINDAYAGRVLDICNLISHEGYYVKMAAAWAVSVCVVKYPEQTYTFLENDRMDTFTHNKAIQKSCESYRVSPEFKAALRKLKRK